MCKTSVRSDLLTITKTLIVALFFKTNLGTHAVLDLSFQLRTPLVEY